MIVTITPNPSVDRTLRVPAFERGGVLRAQLSWTEPSGKGVNVSLALRNHGFASTAVLPIGGPEGIMLRRMLIEAGLDHRAVAIAGDIRSNVSVLEPDGTVSKINEPGPVLTQEELKELRDTAVRVAQRADWLVGCGSLPRGASVDFYADLISEMRGSTTRLAVDTSGPPLVAALRAGPDLVKPNVPELAEATGTPVTTVGDALDAAQYLRGLGARVVLASLGPDGALLVDSGVALHGEAAVPAPRSTVGAGDALLAGFLAGGGAGVPALRTALAWSASAVGQPGTVLHAAGDLTAAQVTIHRHLERNRPLRAV